MSVHFRAKKDAHHRQPPNYCEFYTVAGHCPPHLGSGTFGPTSSPSRLCPYPTFAFCLRAISHSRMLKWDSPSRTHALQMHMPPCAHRLLSQVFASTSTEVKSVGGYTRTERTQCWCLKPYPPNTPLQSCADLPSLDTIRKEVAQYTEGATVVQSPTDPSVFHLVSPPISVWSMASAPLQCRMPRSHHTDRAEPPGRRRPRLAAAPLPNRPRNRPTRFGPPRRRVQDPRRSVVAAVQARASLGHNDAHNPARL